MPLKIQKITGSPEEFALHWAASAVSGDLLALEFELPRFWASCGSDSLLAVYEKSDNALGILVCEADAKTRAKASSAESLHQLGCSLALDTFSSDRAIPLDPVHVPKPWGEEIWFTGMEQRGTARAGRPGRSTPLPWVLSALPRMLCGCQERNLLLLKILASCAQEVVGELYLELHESKREVYVVTAIDEGAWPQGIGAIRFGVDGRVRAEFEGDDHFRNAFTDAVAEYECVRREIDGVLDRGVEEVSEALRLDEQRLREAMNRFIQVLPLAVGDVVEVPTLTPHSLLHGIRVVEFQTPVYERLILSFAQKVLTQAHWDTEKAVASMSLEVPALPSPELLEGNDSVRVERIVDFDGFEVRRIEILPGASAQLETPEHYAVLIGIKGRMIIDDCDIGPEDALLLPARHVGCIINNQLQEPLQFLVGYPKA